MGGLSWETTEDDLIEYFSQYGPVQNVSIKYNTTTGHPRGFGFITFSSEEAIDAVLNAGPHSVKNKVIDPRKAKAKTNSKKIFVGGVDSNTAEEELKEYFSRFGKVDGIELPFDKIRNRRREFCFIIFDTKEAADAACQESKQFINGRDCDIKRAQPQINGGQRGGPRGMPPGNGGGPGGFGQHQQVGYQQHYGAPAAGGGGWGQPAPYNGAPYAQTGGWSNGRQQSQGGPRGGGGQPGGQGRTFHRPRVYTGSGSEGGFNNFA